MQQLLADRFKLAVRWEDRGQAGYALTRGSKATLGPRIRPSDFSCSKLTVDPPPVDKTRRCFIRVVANELDTAGRELSEIAGFLSTLLKRPVVDRTGLVGTYELQLTFDVLEIAQIGGVVAQGGSRSNLPSLFTAIQEQWGLKLESQRINVQTLIVEHVESPSEN
jgi:uncharacterized protein (TIGR03435 family)